MHRRNVLGVIAGIMGILGSTGAALGGQLPDCTIDFDIGCPNDAPICGALFSGGNSCAFEDLSSCYSSGHFSYKITSIAPLTITLSADLIALDVFFAAQGPGSGEMRFFDSEVGGNEVLPSLSTNGDCLQFMPEMQLVTFATPVRRIEVTATIGGTVWIDDFRTNPPVAACPADFDNDGIVGSADLALLLGSWGPCEGCPTDINGDGVADAADLAQLLGAWGPCP